MRVRYTVMTMAVCPVAWLTGCTTELLTRPTATVSDSESDMNPTPAKTQATDPARADARIPPIDRKAPKAFATATFALG